MTDNNLYLSLTLIVLSLSMGCTTPQRSPSSPSIAEKTPSSSSLRRENASVPTFSVESRPSQWTREGDSPGGERYAVLIGIDQYRHHRGWNLPFVRNNTELLKKTLVEDLAFSPQNILTINGEKGTTDFILDSIENGFSPRIQGPGNLFLLYYTGHGFIDGQDRQRRYLTYLSTVDSRRRFKKTLRDMDIKKSLLTLRQKIKSRGKIQTMCIFDACQSPGMAPTAFVPKKIKVSEVTITSCRPGQYAMPNEKADLSIFTEVLCRALKVLSRKSKIEVGTLFQTVAKGMSLGSQKPQIEGEAAGLQLFSRQKIPFRLEVCDSLNPSLALSATVTMEKEKHQTPVFLTHLEQGTYYMTVSAPGYFPRQVRFQLNPRRRGQTHQVFLVPQIHLVTGRLAPVEHGSSAGVEVSISGSFPNRLNQHHRLRQQVFPGEAFHLVTPPFSPPRYLLITEKDRVLIRRKIHRYQLENIGGREVRVYRQGEIALPSTGGDDLPPGVAFAHQEIRQNYRLIVELVKKKNHSPGLAIFRETLSKARKLGDSQGEKRLVQLGRILCRKALEEGLKQGVGRGDFALADKALAGVREFYSNETTFDHLKEKLLQERIPQACRRAFQLGRKALSQSRWEEGEKHFLQALPQANRHYRRKILHHLKPLSRRLYLHYRKKGLQALGKRRYRDGANYLLLALKRENSSALRSIIESEILPHLSDPLQKLYRQKLARIKPVPIIIPQKEKTSDKPSWAPEFPGFTYQGFHTGLGGGKTLQYRHLKTGMPFLLIPAGEFLMGDVLWRESQPVRRVKVKAFLMSKYEVTRKVWQKVMNTTPWQSHRLANRGENTPAICITWYQARAFCQKANLHLPTEAQWEYACRGGTRSHYYWGQQIQPEFAWYRGNSSSTVHEIGQKKANPFGLYDMSGNVAEWCLDTWKDDYRQMPNDGSPYLGQSLRRVCRGGSWNGSGKRCGSGYRTGYSPDVQWPEVGLRPIAKITLPRGWTIPEEKQK